MRLEIGQDVFLGEAVERRQRFVHQQQLRLRQQRASERDPLALAPRKAERQALQQVFDAEQIGDFVELNAGLRPTCGRAAVAVKKIAPHRHVGKQARLLEYVADRPAIRRPKAGTVLPDFIFDGKVPVRQPQQSGGAAQHRRLPASRWSEQGRKSACRRFERGVELEFAHRAAKAPADDAVVAHAMRRPARFSSTIMVKITANANTSIPPERI